MRSFKTLADLAQDPKNWVKASQPGDLPRRIREYKVLCLDDDATLQACYLHHSKPRQIVDMLSVAQPPWPHMWVEMDTNTLLGTRAQMAKAYGNSYQYEKRPEHSRVALRIDKFDEHFEVFVLETSLDGKQVFEWPLGFDIGLNDHHFAPMKKDAFIKRDGGVLMEVKGAMSPVRQAAVVWGYEPDVKGLSGLARRARVHTLSPYALAMTPEIVRNCCTELGGTTRLAVAILAMLNTVLIVDEPSRPKGRFLSRSGSKGYVDRSVSYLNIGPRIRNREDYVRNAVRDEISRRCLHEVRGHWRYLRRKPSVPGWERVEHEGEVYWRKFIEAHKRGDPALGDSSERVTIVKGRNPLFDTGNAQDSVMPMETFKE